MMLERSGQNGDHSFAVRETYFMGTSFRFYSRALMKLFTVIISIWFSCESGARLIMRLAYVRRALKWR